MLNFVNFKDWAPAFHQHILDVMLGILSNLFMAKLTDISAYLRMLIELKDSLGVGRKSIKCK